MVDENQRLGLYDDEQSTCQQKRQVAKSATTEWEAVAADQAMTIAMLKLEQKREWVGLTIDEIDKFMPYCHSEFDLAGFRDFARDIEGKLKEKNG